VARVQSIFESGKQREVLGRVRYRGVVEQCFNFVLQSENL